METDGTVDNLVRLLNSPVEDIREQASWCLGNIAGDSTSCRDSVLEAGAVAAMSKLCSTFDANTRISTIRNCMWTSSNLCRGKPLPPLELVQDLIPILATQINSADIDSVSDACVALSNISDGSNERIQAVLDSGCAIRVVQLLGAVPDDKIQAPTLRLVGNIMTGNDSQTQSVIDLGVLPVLLELLDHSRKNVRKEVCWTFSNVTSGTAMQVQAVLETPGVIAKIISMMQSDDVDIQREATWVVSNATSNCVPDQISQLVELGAVAPLTEILKSTDGSKSIEVALEGIENILSVTKEYNRVAFQSAVNTICAHDGLKALKILQDEGGTCGHRAALVLETFVAELDYEEETPTVTQPQQESPAAATNAPRGVIPSTPQHPAATPVPSHTQYTYAVGARVEVASQGTGTYSPATIIHRMPVSDDVGQAGAAYIYNVNYDGGGGEEYGVVESRIRALSRTVNTPKHTAVTAADTAANLTAPAGVTAFAEGTRVEANYHGAGVWYGGVISRCRYDNTYDIVYDDGDSEPCVDGKLIRLPMAVGVVSSSAHPSGGLTEGTKCEANYRGKGVYYTGKVARDNHDGTYDIAYDDGEDESRVLEEHIRKFNTTEVVAEVPAVREKPKKRWKSGKILKKYPDGTYDIALSGGGILTRVQRSIIRPARSNPAIAPADD